MLIEIKNVNWRKFCRVKPSGIEKRFARNLPKQVHWTDRKIQIVYLLALAGFNESKMAEIMEISQSTFDHWKKTKPEFYQALQNAKYGVNTKVAESFLSMCLGYEYEEEIATFDRKTKEYIKTTIKRFRPPDPWAASKWLAMKMRDQGWSETARVEITQTNNVNFNMNILSTDELKFLEEIAKKSLPSVGDIIETST